MDQVGVVEFDDNWSPFQECSDDEEQDDDDEDDGVSETWGNDKMDEDHEEGEFIPEAPIAPESPMRVPAAAPSCNGIDESVNIGRRTDVPLEFENENNERKGAARCCG
ncbi:hypothetical protein L2E82_23202 [Cichorium intybus]|uniref:Uncharacterized protein n=1 Tax=Cichorium intybus TaxID=13427 RepID=A0ACB9DZS5_CICIN|nr:hypothetical protein L2E82_23202 [Cichorium intybus]